MKKLFLIILIFTFSSCDYDKYISYHTDAQELLKTAIVDGRIIHFYTRAPVFNALVKVGLQETVSDINGFYKLNYVLSEDDERNKPILIQISAPNFYPENTTVSIEPFGNNHNFELKYAAPIIKNAARISGHIESTCQAIVFDYQGWQNIDSVYALFFGVDNDEVYKFSLSLVNTYDDNTGYYQFKYEDRRNFKLRYSIFAVDYENFRDRLDKANDEYHTDRYIF